MARRPLQLLVFVFFVASLTFWGVAKGEPAAALLPSVQTIDGASFDQTVERGFSAQALPRSVIREGRVVATAAPFTHFMLRWETSLTGTEQLAFEARASIDGVVWTDWGSVAENDDLSDPEQAPDVRWSTTVYAGVAQFWQLRVILTPMEGGPLPVLRTVQVNTLDTRVDEPSPRGECRVRSVSIRWSASRVCVAFSVGRVGGRCAERRSSMVSGIACRDPSHGGREYAGGQRNELGRPRASGMVVSHLYTRMG